MGREELLAGLAALAVRVKTGDSGHSATRADCEDAHQEAEALLLQYIDDAEVSQAFNALCSTP